MIRVALFPFQLWSCMLGPETINKSLTEMLEQAKTNETQKWDTPSSRGNSWAIDVSSKQSYANVYHIFESVCITIQGYSQTLLPLSFLLHPGR